MYKKVMLSSAILMSAMQMSYADDCISLKERDSYVPLFAKLRVLDMDEKQLNDLLEKMFELKVHQSTGTHIDKSKFIKETKARLKKDIEKMKPLKKSMENHWKQGSLLKSSDSLCKKLKANLASDQKKLEDIMKED